MASTGNTSELESDPSDSEERMKCYVNACLSHVRFVSVVKIDLYLFSKVIYKCVHAPCGKTD